MWSSTLPGLTVKIIFQIEKLYLMMISNIPAPRPHLNTFLVSWSLYIHVAVNSAGKMG